jgi:hypothetical protein
MFPIQSSQVVGRPDTPLTCITAFCPHETLPRAPMPERLSKVIAGKEPKGDTRSMADRRWVGVRGCVRVVWHDTF